MFTCVSVARQKLPRQMLGIKVKTLRKAPTFTDVTSTGFCLHLTIHFTFCLSFCWSVSQKLQNQFPYVEGVNRGIQEFSLLIHRIMCIRMRHYIKKTESHHLFHYFFRDKSGRVVEVELQRKRPKPHVAPNAFFFFLRSCSHRTTNNNNKPNARGFYIPVSRRLIIHRRRRPLLHVGSSSGLP